MNGLVDRGQIGNRLVIAFEDYEHVFEAMLQSAGIQENFLDRAPWADGSYGSREAGP